MNTVLEMRIRAASAEMSKPGRWRVALEQLDQATTQIVAAPETDTECAALALESLQLLYQWASVMSGPEYHRLNRAVMQLTDYIAQESPNA